MSFLKVQLIVLVVTIFFGFNEVFGHGMMLDPVSRSSRWRYNHSAIINKNDNALNCGGMNILWNKNSGKCGLCGDNFSVVRPRPNELGGKYGDGVITKIYTQGQKVHVGIKITKNHLGLFYFNICNLDKFKKESEECFENYTRQYSAGIGKKAGWVNVTLPLPKDMVCKHCVLRWSYRTGDNWGRCTNGKLGQGCGPQGLFRGCADISVKPLRSFNYLQLELISEALRKFEEELNVNEKRAPSFDTDKAISELETEEATDVEEERNDKDFLADQQKELRKDVGDGDDGVVDPIVMITL